MQCRALRLQLLTVVRDLSQLSLQLRQLLLPIGDGKGVPLKFLPHALNLLLGLSQLFSCELALLDLNQQGSMLTGQLPAQTFSFLFETLTLSLVMVCTPPQFFDCLFSSFESLYLFLSILEVHL